MKISISEAAKRWGVSRTTVYQKINDGELSRGSDKKIDVSEMLRVFGEPPNNEQQKDVLNKTVNTVRKTPLNKQSEQLNAIKLEHKLEIERLKNEQLEQQVREQKILIEDYQQQIKQLNKSLAQATASINEFAQTRLLELKIKQTNLDEQSEKDVHDKSELRNDKIDQESTSIGQVSSAEPTPNKKKKWRWW